MCVWAAPGKVQLEAYYGQSQRNFIKAKGAKGTGGAGAGQVAGGHINLLAGSRLLSRL